jgi:hypothetical protein
MAHKTRIHFEELPCFMSVFAIADNDIVSIECHSKLHKNRVCKMPTQYDRDYYEKYPEETRQEILDWIAREYRLRMSARYSF